MVSFTKKSHFAAIIPAKYRMIQNFNKDFLMKKVVALLIALGLTSVFAAEANATKAEKNTTKKVEKKAKAKKEANATKKAEKNATK